MDNWNIINYNSFNNTYRHLPLIRNMIRISYTIYVVITAACWMGTYRLIKTAKY